METYLRMMVLKYRYGLGFERLCAEVSDSVSWRRFCRVSLDEASRTARHWKTTAVRANLKHPTDSDLLAHGVSRLAVLSCRRKAMGLAKRTRARDRRRSMTRRAHAIGAWLRGRSDEAKDEVLAITAEMAAIADTALAEAAQVAANSARTLRRQGQAAPGRAYGLEWDHAPVAHNGPTSYDNLRPRCKPHNWHKTKQDCQAGLFEPPRPP
jgi:IS5 family transposase